MSWSSTFTPSICKRGFKRAPGRTAWRGRSDNVSIVDYRENWREYRRTRNLFFLVWAGYVPATLAFAILVWKVFRTFVPGFVFAGLWIVLFVMVGGRVSRWPCPRCGECFAGTWWYNLGFFARKCVHCGLSKFASDTGSGTAQDKPKS